MKFLIDQNISFRIIPLISTQFKNCHHIKEFDLINKNDSEIFEYAKKNNFDAIITSDEDFYNIVQISKPPPKIIWLRTGNVSTKYLSDVLLKNFVEIELFIKNDLLECLQIIK